MKAVPPQAAHLVVGTRRSALAQRQTELVVDLLRSARSELTCDIRPIVTEGDRTQRSGRPLPEIGGKGLFTSALEDALRRGDLDLAVHSLKDLPTEDLDGIAVGAVCSREDVRDCLVSREGVTLEELPSRSRVGTSSLRRTAQLLALRPDLEIASIRGNVDSRIRKVRDGEYDATVLAAAGIVRLGLEGEVTQRLPLETMLPAPGQGALAVQCRVNDERALELLAAIDDPATRAATGAERGFLRALGAGCTAPVAAYAELVDAAPSAPSDDLSQGNGAASRVRLRGLVLSSDGRDVARVEGEGVADDVGERLAREALDSGADRILRAVRG